MLGLRDCICILAPRDAVRVLDWPEVCGRVEREPSLPPIREYFDPGRVLMDFVRILAGRSRSTGGPVVYTGAVEKYLGMPSAKSGRIAGRQAQMIPTLTSTTEIVAWSELSNVRSLEFARLSRLYNRIVETAMTLSL